MFQRLQGHLLSRKKLNVTYWVSATRNLYIEETQIGKKHDKGPEKVFSHNEFPIVFLPVRIFRKAQFSDIAFAGRPNLTQLLRLPNLSYSLTYKTP